MAMRTSILVLSIPFFLLFGACDSAKEDAPEEKYYDVKYEVEGNFDICTILYLNAESEEVRTDEILPWEESFRVKVTPTSSFAASVNAVCSNSGDYVRYVDMKILVDGTEVESRFMNGIIAGATLNVILTMDGVYK